MDEQNNSEHVGETAEVTPPPAPPHQWEGRKERRRTSSKPPSGRRPPAWVPYFLSALERTGEVRSAAADAGIDFTTAYARRKAHAGFAREWEEALTRFRAAKEVAGEAELSEAMARIKASASTVDFASLEDQGLTVRPSRTGKVKLVEMARSASLATVPRTVASTRWSEAKERIFLEELTRTANVRLAAAAAGVSTQALYQRRLRDRRLAGAWDQAVEFGKVRLQAYLLEAATRTFDPGELPIGDEGPTVSIAEAINIARLKAPGAAAGGGRKGDDAFFAGAEEDEQQYEETLERVRDKLHRACERTRGEQLEKGWRPAEEHDVMVPPGWGRPEDMAIADGGPRSAADWHCPHCGGGLKVVLPDVAD